MPGTKRKFESKEIAARTIAKFFKKSRRRSAFAKMRRYRRPKKPLALKAHNFVERSGSDLITIKPDANAVGLFKSFELSHIQQYSAYTTLFELYRIDKVVVTFRYKSIGGQARVIDVSGSLPVNEVNPVLYFKVDHNDADTDTLVNLKQSMRCREHQFTNDKPNFSIVLKPAVLIEDENIKGATGTNYRPKWGMWLDTDESGIEHYGLKAYCVGATGSSTTDAGQLEVTYKTYFSVKNNE